MTGFKNPLSPKKIFSKVERSRPSSATAVALTMVSVLAADAVDASAPTITAAADVMPTPLHLYNHQPGGPGGEGNVMKADGDRRATSRAG